MITRTLSDGRILEVKAVNDFDCEASINGVVHTTSRLGRLPKPKTIKGTTIHYLLGNIGITKDEGLQLEAEMKALAIPPDPVWTEYRSLQNQAHRIELKYRDHPGELYPRRGDIQAKFAAWHKKYPEYSRQIKVQALEAKATKQEELATGALHYDADGWLNDSARQAIHDKLMAKAAAIRAEIAQAHKGE